MSTHTNSKLKSLALEGNRTLVDPETGEQFNVRQVCVNKADANFSKIWLANILNAVNEFSSASMDILFWLVKQTEKTRGTNTIAMTIREIADETGRSTHSVNKVLKVLEKNDVIRRKTGVIFVNPDVIYKGAHGGRMDILLSYKAVANVPAEEESVQARIERNAIALQQLEKRYKAIQAELERDLESIPSETGNSDSESNISEGAA